MTKEISQRTPGSSSRMRTIGVSTFAGCAIGLGALSAVLAPTASADSSWWLFSGNDANIAGNNGNGNSSQYGFANGNIGNAQNNIPILSPNIASGIATNAAPAIGGAAVG